MQKRATISPVFYFSKNFGVAPHIQNVMEQGKLNSINKTFPILFQSSCLQFLSFP